MGACGKGSRIRGTQKYKGLICGDADIRTETRAWVSERDQRSLCRRNICERKNRLYVEEDFNFTFAYVECFCCVFLIKSFFKGEMTDCDR